MTIELVPIEGLPEIVPGDDLVGLLVPVLLAEGIRDGDVIVVTSKIVSKAEGRLVPGTDRDRAVADETVRVVARRGDLVIAETRHGFICANAGVDSSNLAAGVLALLPEDPDGSADRIRDGVATAVGLETLGVVITDTFGRAWRTGLVNVAIGCAGLPAVVDLRGKADHHGHRLEATVVAYADEIAAASGLVMAKDARVPVAIVRGLTPQSAPVGLATELRRPREEDLFRESPLESLRATRSPASFGPGALPRELVEEAILIAASGEGPSGANVRFSVVTSAGGRRGMAAVLPATRDAAATIVISAAREDDPLVVGAVIERLRLGLGAQGLGASWLASVPASTALAVGALVGLAPGTDVAGIVVCGRMPEGGARAPRPPDDPVAVTTWG